jgi:transcription initiation factor IIE alpha subunit
MDESKYDRAIPFHCPTCAGTRFSSDDSSEDDAAFVTCASCGRVMTRAELREANSENIEEHVQEIGKQVTKDVADELIKMLKNTFKNSKNITIK